MSFAFPFNFSSSSKDFDAAARPASTIFRIFRLLGVGLFFYLMLVAIRATAQEAVELSWDHDPTTLVTQYRIWYGTHTGVYTNTFVISAEDNIEIDGLKGGTTYYFAIQAMDQQGDVSPLSNEAVYTVQVIQPVNLQFQIFNTEEGPIYEVEGSVNPPGTWELDYSTDLVNWTILDYSTGDTVQHDDFLTQPKMFFRVIHY